MKVSPLLIVALVLMSNQADSHSPLSMVRTLGRWVSRPLRSLGTGVHLVPIAHFAKKAIAAKKLKVIKGKLVAKPLLAKAALFGLAAHHGRSLFPASARDNQVEQVQRNNVQERTEMREETTRTPLLRRLLPQRIHLPEVVVPIRLSFEGLNNKVSQTGMLQMKSTQKRE